MNQPLFLALDGELLLFENKSGSWHVVSKLKGTEPQSVAIDPLNPETVYCATFLEGLWVSEDAGKKWNRIGKQALPPQITSLSVSSLEGGNQRGIVYVGTEPSELYCSKDGGENFANLSKEMLNLSSSKSWSFPPKPYTHHVRTILVDPGDSNLIYVAIEAGALIRSFDGGKTWNDRVRGGPYDTHNLVSSPESKGRLYAAAGDGYFESLDHGETWVRKEKGLKEIYLYSVAVSFEDPDSILVSASQSPWSAYNARNAQSHIYKKVSPGWREIKAGLPSFEGTTASFLVSKRGEKEGFLAANNKGIYESSDAGETWTPVEVPWQDSFRAQHVHCMAIA